MRDRRLAKGLGLLCLLAVTVLGVWAFWLEPDRVVVNRVSLSLPDWPASYQPVRLALVSDIHAGAPFITSAKIDAVVSAIQDENPDAIVLLGDYVIQGVFGGDFMTPENLAPHLARLHAPLGVYGVLGNHDWWLDGARVRRALRSAGIVMIDNAARKIERPGGSFWLVGIGDALEGAPDIAGAVAKLSDTAPAVLATHNPDLFPQVPRRIALSVAGHTHGGQVHLPFVGRPVVPSRYGERYASGLIVEDGRRLFVTTGLGTSILPVRFRVTPEIVILTIRTGESQIGSRPSAGPAR